jgi:hypothetical protein
MRHSKKYTIDIRDIFHGFITAFLTSSIAGIMSISMNGELPSIDQIKSQLLVGACAGLGYLVKKFFSTSENKPMGEEPDNSLK